MFDILVTAMSLIALGFLALWWLRPELRDRMEAPKYQFRRWDRDERPRT